jgi:alpha-tubulin suppressor-like RCC1 family protein
VKVRLGSGYLSGVVSVTAGTGHTCALKGDGTVWCWGDASSGQVGDGTTGDAVDHRRLTPRKVRQGSGVLDGVAAITAGSFHTCALKRNGSVWCWGFAAEGQLGDGTTGDPATHVRLSAVQVRRGSGFLTGATAVSAGDGRHTCALNENGSVWCWGDDQYGELGDGTTGDPATHVRSKAVQVRRGSSFLIGMEAIASGGDHACARRSDGTAWCWGFDLNGQLGDGTTGDPIDHVRL